jgi:hypothetical protein
MEAFCCTDLHTTPAQILPWVVMRWWVEVTCEEARAHLGLETQRQWSDLAIAWTTPVLLAVCSIVTVLALQVSQSGQIPVSPTTWSHKAKRVHSSFFRGFLLSLLLEPSLVASEDLVEGLMIVRAP